MPPLLVEDDESVVLDDEEAVDLDLVEGPDELLGDEELDEEDLGDEAADAEEEEDLG
jgi:hypothetical protein